MTTITLEQIAALQAEFEAAQINLAKTKQALKLARDEYAISVAKYKVGDVLVEIATGNRYVVDRVVANSYSQTPAPEYYANKIKKNGRPSALVSHLWYVEDAPHKCAAFTKEEAA